MQLKLHTKSISRKYDKGIVLDNGVMILETRRHPKVESYRFCNSVAAYKDIIDPQKRQSNYHSMGMEIKL